MLRTLAIAILTAALLDAAPASTGAASLGKNGGHGLRHHGGAFEQSRSASHLWPGGARLGGGMSHRYGEVSPGGSGWYNRGFGGTTNPGWGYGFGPNLGGSNLGGLGH